MYLASEEQEKQLQCFIEYLTSLNITVNLCKNKALGKKGFFKMWGNNYRIDIAKNQSLKEVLSVLVHEFAHYIHCIYDQKMSSLEFILGRNWLDYSEELIQLTVKRLPKDYAASLFNKKYKADSEIEYLTNIIRQKYPDFKRSANYLPLEKLTIKAGLKYLLSYDNVQVKDLFGRITLYQISKVEQDFPNLDKNIVNYLKFKSEKRKLSRVNAKISRLNKYYSNYSELFARSVEFFILDTDTIQKLAPNLYQHYMEIIRTNKIIYLTKMYEIFND